MEENKVTGIEAEASNEEQEAIQQEKDKLRKQFADMKARTDEIREAMSSGKGRLALETVIKSGDGEFEALEYDFTALTGMEYTDAMDSDANAQQAFRMTNRQALALFARAAAKQTPDADAEDIVAGIGATDAVEAVELATLFFTASTRAGRMRISKRS